MSTTSAMGTVRRRKRPRGEGEAVASDGSGASGVAEGVGGGSLAGWDWAFWVDGSGAVFWLGAGVGSAWGWVG